MNLINVSQLRADNILNIQGKVDIFSKKEINIEKGEKRARIYKKIRKTFIISEKKLLIRATIAYAKGLKCFWRI